MSIMRKPLFSFIIPAYNIENYIAECLESLISQSCNEWEAILVDDGSIDQTGKIIDEYSRKDKRIHVFHQNNLGVSAARNKGIELAVGEWICFVDGDDFIHPDYLHICFHAIKEHPGKELLSFAHIQQKNPCLKKLELYPEPQVLDIGQFIPEQLWHRSLYDTIYLKEAFNNIRFMDSPMGEDLLFYRQCLLKASSVIFMNSILYAYRIREGSAVNSALSLKKIRGSMECAVKCLQELWLSGKKISSRQYMLLLRTVFESPAYRCRTIDQKEEVKDLFNEWLGLVLTLNNKVFLPFGYRCSLKIVVITNSCSLWLVLFGEALHLKILLCGFRDSLKSVFRKLCCAL